ncbi:APC family permease [Pseudoblastomonas halimionae]|uniref:Amino acid permease n=1 Tax=Alteriqipengyuania halimionae TaxID=1926630 RepID=A0A6I4U5Z7_9SPHN|nr:APC family permease [Alteriqipengyuania halimionae]MXP09872.1 amino acid permease [Alteriqipengyuania halimionae]
MTNTTIAPPRTVGFWGTALFPVNGMIGAGIFALPAVLAAALGNFAPWLMLLGGLMFLPLALVYAWLAARFEHSGGPVLYGEAAFGRFIGFQAGWARYASNIVTAAANTHVMVTYLAALFPWLGGDMQPIAVAVLLAFFVVVNLVGMKSAVGTLGVMTAVKLLPLLLLVIAGLFGGEPGIGFTLPQFTEVESVILLTYYAFMGFETVTEAAGEMKRAKRNVPLAMVSMVMAVTLLYVLVIWAYLAIAPDAAEDNALAGAARVIMGDWAAVLIVIAAAFSIGANNLGSGTTLPRLTYGMSERGLLPRWFAKVDPRFHTPRNSILFYGVFAVLFGLWEGFEVLAVAGTLVRLTTYLICSAALPVLEKREGALNPLHLACSLFAIASTIWVATHADARAWMTLAAIIAGGTLLYFIASRERPAGVID